MTGEEALRAATARTLIALMRGNVVTDVKRALVLLGLTVADLQESRRAADADIVAAIADTHPAPPPPAPTPAPRPTRPFTGRRMPPNPGPRNRARRWSGAAGELQCSRCLVIADATWFALRADRPGYRDSLCSECRAEYRAGRYLSVAKLGQLGHVGIELADVGLDGLVCVVCRLPIMAHQDAVVDGYVRHGTCAQVLLEPRPTPHPAAKGRVVA